MPAAKRPAKFDDDERAAWAGFLGMHATVTRRLDVLLSGQEGVTLTEFEVLLKLSLHGGRLRMSDLAEAAWLSRSGLTRIVDDLQRDGLVDRVTSQDDARVTYATLTTAGRRRFALLRTTHVANVRELFLDPLSAEQRRALADAWRTIAEALPEEAGRPRRTVRRRRGATGRA